MKNKLTQEYLKECLDYNLKTGEFVWKERPINHFKTERVCNIWNTRFKNKKAGSKHSNGYSCITIDYKTYLSHRIAFLYVEGYIPENEVDHMNRNRSDNRWKNLRKVSTSCNSQNCSVSKNNTTGVTGVYYDKSRCKWLVNIKINYKDKYLGRFDDFNDAVIARYNEEKTNPNWTCSLESLAYKYLKENNLLL